jgi:alpha-1,2-mannosyltransferase
MYGYGLQTWEYSAEFALRSWWYLLLHAAIGAPATWLFGSEKGKITVFYIIRAALAIGSAVTEWWLYKAVAARYTPSTSNIFLSFLVVSSGMFAASAALLPSSFTMYALTAAAAAVIAGKHSYVIFSAVIGVIWGWCVAGVAFLPYAFWILTTARLLPAIGTLFIALIATLAPLAVADRVFYGNWKASLWNFLVYNVAGGGQSALYGVEGPLYYLRNGFNQLQFVLPLSLVLPLVGILSWCMGTLVDGKSSNGSGSGTAAKKKGQQQQRKSLDINLFIAVSPVFLWLAAITALPHKEERFLFVVYPLACLAAAAALDTIATLATKILPTWKNIGHRLSTLGIIAVVCGTAVLSISRTVALISHYGAPISIYRALPALKDTTTNIPHATPPPINVCVGAEWHRFPSSFFLPGPTHRIQFIKSGFDGLLPRAFDDSHGGTRAAPRQLNDQNRREPENYWEDSENCDYAVTLRDSNGWLDGGVLGLENKWEVVAREPFLDAGQSWPLTRAFYIPWLSGLKNKWLSYELLKKVEIKKNSNIIVS